MLPKTRQKIRRTGKHMAMAVLLGWSLAQTAAAQVHASYADRQNPRLSKSGPIYMDPNVYVYTAEFAKRFRCLASGSRQTSRARTLPPGG